MKKINLDQSFDNNFLIFINVIFSEKKLLTFLTFIPTFLTFIYMYVTPPSYSVKFFLYPITKNNLNELVLIEKVILNNSYFKNLLNSDIIPKKNLIPEKLLYEFHLLLKKNISNVIKASDKNFKKINDENEQKNYLKKISQRIKVNYNVNQTDNKIRFISVNILYENGFDPKNFLHSLINQTNKSMQSSIIKKAKKIIASLNEIRDFKIKSYEILRSQEFLNYKLKLKNEINFLKEKLKIIDDRKEYSKILERMKILNLQSNNPYTSENYQNYSKRINILKYNGFFKQINKKLDKSILKETDPTFVIENIDENFLSSIKLTNKNYEKLFSFFSLFFILSIFIVTVRFLYLNKFKVL